MTEIWDMASVEIKNLATQRKGEDRGSKESLL